MKSKIHNKFGRHLLMLHLLVAGALALAACQPIVDTRTGETMPAVQVDVAATETVEEEVEAEEVTEEATEVSESAAEETAPEEDIETTAEITVDAEILLDPAVAIITTRSLRVREFPDSESEVVAGARENESYPVIAISADGAWVQIEIERSETGVGWVSTNFISLEGDITETETAPVAAPSATDRAQSTPFDDDFGPTATVDTRSLVVRAEPDEDSEVIAGLNLGDSFNVLGISLDGVWLQLELTEINEGAGWVQANFVRLAGDLTAIPTIGEPEVEDAIADEESDEVADEEIEATEPATGELAFSTATVNTRSLFVRELPDADSDPVAGAREGESYVVIAISDDGEWVQIETARSETGVGWVFAELVILE